MAVVMILATVCLAGLSGVLTLSGSNVCTRTRLVPSTSVHSLDYLQSHCELVGFTASACEAARNNEIQFSALYVADQENVCCEGYQPVGDICTACPGGRYGEQCLSSCQCFKSTGCDHVTGACSCSAGWKGEHCEQRCAVGEYGTNCALTSLDLCENDGVSHPSQGHCLCSWTWMGNVCTEPCSSRVCPLESDSCSNGATFDPTGHCLCAPGYRGRYCTERCNETLHGEYCSNQCQCQNNGLCNWEDGSCLCKPGFHGERCEQTCADGTYGADCALTCDCPGSGSCNHINGSCIECPTGFTGSRCLEHCPNLWYGPSCNTPCDCQNGLSCDRFTGHCPGGSQTESDSGPSSTTTSPAARASPIGKQHDGPGRSTTQSQVPVPIDNSIGGGDTSSNNDTLVILTAACVSILTFSVLFFVTIYVIKNKPCRRDDSIKPDQQPVSQPNQVPMEMCGNEPPSHEYAYIHEDHTFTDSGEYVDMRESAYEIPMTVDLGKPTGPPNSPNSFVEGNRYERHPNYATTIVNTNQPLDIRPGPDGYLGLDHARGPPPAYHSIHAPANI
ncbi:uncharacterized protein [Diadema antillarum]|uniref:uncharacterized protein n=1 Tax=Diadema antillarum TaxID=105358 RepID=UPI003A893EB9